MKQQVVFEEKDMKKLEIKVVDQIGRLHILALGPNRYVCMQAINKHRIEYRVIDKYKEYSHLSQSGSKTDDRIPQEYRKPSSDSDFLPDWDWENPDLVKYLQK